MTLLEVTNLEVHYGKVQAIKGIDIRLEAADIITLIGANGAGKSTTLRTLSGLSRPTTGTILFEGERIDGLEPDRIVARGIAHVPEGRRVFPELTVLENLMTGAYLRRDGPSVRSDLDMVYGHFPRLRERRGQYAKTLSGGEQQMLAMGRALMAAPRLLLMDEPSIGLSPLMVQEIAAIIGEINRKGVPVVLVEQNASLALHLASYGYVLETGRIALSGPTDVLRENEHVRRAYLGG
ncbi:MAG: ABC transporter ATP-binding protein [bacterium]|nr:ABC transporter ATP-binding protein [bacterium]MDE0240773.1 ABC transporter ATP-binding protein [bacterium]MDE0418454.1 ABC transporter ATP-binding protein [bacterium]